MGKKIGLFHVISLVGYGHSIIYEPILNEYIWFVLYVNRNRRGKGITRRLFTYSTDLLEGTHHIHYPVGIKSIDGLCDEFDWQEVSESPYFHNCRYFKYIKAGHRNRRRTKEAKHKIVSHIPHCVSFECQENLPDIVEAIDSDFDTML